MIGGVRNFTNEVVNGLRILGVYRDERTQALTWQAICTKCGTSGQTFEHRFLVDGSARCKASICAVKTEASRATSSAGSAATVRTGSVRAREGFDGSVGVTYTVPESRLGEMLAARSRR